MINRERISIIPSGLVITAAVGLAWIIGQYTGKTNNTEDMKKLQSSHKMEKPYTPVEELDTALISQLSTDQIENNFNNNVALIYTEHVADVKQKARLELSNLVIADSIKKRTGKLIEKIRENMYITNILTDMENREQFQYDGKIFTMLDKDNNTEKNLGPLGITGDVVVSYKGKLSITPINLTNNKQYTIKDLLK